MTNPYEAWKYHELTYAKQLEDAWKGDAKSVGFDTEATGLHILKDKPFLFQIGWGRNVYLFEPHWAMMQTVFKIFNQVKWVFAHNIKYDLNMMCNIGYEKEVKKVTGWCDSISVMRLAVESKSPREGGDTMQLKPLGVKYVHPYADNSEVQIKAALKKLNDERVKVLTAALKQFDKVGAFTPTGKQQKWGKKHIEDFLKDPTNELEDLQEEIREIWMDWQEEYPEPTYADIPKEIMNQYAGEDVATMMELMEYALPIVIAREQMKVLQRERDMIIPALMMEREGMPVDLEYLHESKAKMQTYIRTCRAEMAQIAGEIITVGQHARLKQLFDQKWDIALESADKSTLEKVIANFDGEAKRFAQLINTLRTAEKWYSTYIKRVLALASFDGKAYTQINLSGAISGRMSSDFQQFPRDGFNHLDTGEELYRPRRAFIVGGDDYEMVYIDYDQIELVTQAHYCVVLKAEGTNLARAYMPYKCHHYLTGQEYNFKDPDERAKWREVRENGDTVWLTENGSLWERTDLHTMTAASAFPDADITSQEFKKKLRPLGKKTNFASNYGGSSAALEGDVVEGLTITWEIAEKLVEGYNKAFPEVKYYQEMIQKAHAQKGYIKNWLDRRYYLKNNRDAYKLANAGVQGTCADAFKDAIIELYDFLEGKKSKMVLPVHDEMSFKIYDDERWIMPYLQEIMERAFGWCLVPVTAGIETSRTYWSAKKEYEAEEITA